MVTTESLDAVIINTLNNYKNQALTDKTRGKLKEELKQAILGAGN